MHKYGSAAEGGRSMPRMLVIGVLWVTLTVPTLTVATGASASSPAATTAAGTGSGQHHKCTRNGWTVDPSPAPGTPYAAHPKVTNFGAAPSAGSGVSPGLALPADQVRQLAEMDNDDFICLRESILAKAGPLSHLRRTFFTNGCTGLPRDLTQRQKEDLFNACVQHDFSYTAGPNAFAGSAAEEFRKMADEKLANEAGPVLGPLIREALGRLGHKFFTQTDAEGNNTSKGILEQAINPNPGIPTNSQDAISRVTYHPGGGRTTQWMTWGALSG
ncbi:hypothetical protein [Streptomyces sp. cg36]|uniref:hypothetical protein n=1 Tax=Streptomyces sp. cg36 TaxID=3238798 RepID=UPI0034E200E4